MLISVLALQFAATTAALHLAIAAGILNSAGEQQFTAAQSQAADTGKAPQQKDFTAAQPQAPGASLLENIRRAHRADKFITGLWQKRDERRRKIGDCTTVTAILPAAIVQPASRAARLWCLVRSLDHPENGGTGSGLVEISLAELGRWLNRSERSIWRYLKDALTKGYLRSCRCEYGQLRIEYRGLKSLCKVLGLQHLGAIGEFPLEQIQHAKAHATDIQAEKLQAQSFHQMKKEYKKYARGAKQAADLLSDATSSARVPGGVRIARGRRLLYLAPHWRPFGGSQKGIADRLGVSLRTVQYRLSNAWRGERGIAEIEKAQAAHQVFEDCPKSFLKDFMRLEENASQRFVFLHSRLFQVRCNLYDTGVLLRNQRYRQVEYRESLEACYKNSGSPGVLHEDYRVNSQEENLAHRT